LNLGVGAGGEGGGKFGKLIELREDRLKYRDEGEVGVNVNWVLGVSCLNVGWS
jgi:hypothetical protein